jgi:protein TonB
VPREIFGDVVNPAPKLGSQSGYTLPLSMAAHAAVAAVLVIVPLMATDAVPTPRTVVGAFTAGAELPEPPPPPAGPAGAVKTEPAPVPASVAPSVAPSAISAEPETTRQILGDPNGVAGGLPNGTIGGTGFLPDVPSIPAPPPPPGPQRVGGRIKEPNKLRHVPPVYPAIAQQARVEGKVIVEAIIGIDGRVREARVVVSKPLLDEAALSAVRQWVFTPTLLNGVPVPVIMTVTVQFRLN